MAATAFKSIYLLTLTSLLCIGAIRTETIAQDTLHTTIYFDTDQYKLLDTHREKITALLDSISAVTQIDKVIARGYADLRGGATANQQLSERRVHSISSYLLQQYPDHVQRIYSSGMGAAGSRDNLSQYRRVDIEIICSRGGIKTYTDAVEVTDISQVDVTTLKAGTYLKIKNLNFQPGRSILLQSAIPHLKELETLLLTHKNIHIQIDGHICCQAEFENRTDGRDIDKNTDDLSTQRAKNIHDYLMRRGIDTVRLAYKGYGHSRPYVHPEVSETDRIQNRRVEILITKI